MILIFGCLRRLVSLFLLAVIGLLIWYFRGTIVAAWHHVWSPRSVAVAPLNPGREAEAKLHALESARGGARGGLRIAFSQAELQTLLHTRFAGMLPRWVDSARIQLQGERMRLSGRIPLERLPHLKSLGELAGFLPETAEVVVTGQVFPLGRGRVALGVDQITAAHVPLPHRLIPQMLAELKRGRAQSGVPSDALLLPLPRTITSAYVRKDSLILLAGVPATTAGPGAAPRRR